MRLTVQIINKRLLKTTKMCDSRVSLVKTGRKSSKRAKEGHLLSNVLYKGSL